MVWCGRNMLLTSILVIMAFTSTNLYTTHTEEWRDMERDTHRVIHTKIKRGGGKRKEGEND